MRSLDHLDYLVISRVQLKQIFGVLNRDDLILNSDHKKRGNCQLPNPILHRIEVIYAKICLFFDRPRDDLQGCIEHDLRDLRILLGHIFHQSL